MSDQLIHLYIIAGEASGDQLGAKLIRSIRETYGPHIQFHGIGGPAMTKEGFESLFPMSDIAVMGLAAVLARVFQLKRRINQTVFDIKAKNPDCLIIIDSPGFTHRVAKKIVSSLTDLPVVQYVSPTVWAWRPWRARHMTAFVDQVLAILPFEPLSHAKLGGPPCTYVGHPLLENELIYSENSSAHHGEGPINLLMMPGSRRSEIAHMLGIYYDTALELQKLAGDVNISIPVVDHLFDIISDVTDTWSIPVTLIKGDEHKYQAMATSHCALITSGTATLEVALAGVPLVVAYKLDRMARIVGPILKLIPGFFNVKFFALPNVIADRQIVPEYLNNAVDCVVLAKNLEKLARETVERQEQLDGFQEIRKKMALSTDVSPSTKAARVIGRILGLSQVGPDDDEKV